MFKKIYDINKLKEEITASELCFVYFGQPNCSVCHGLKPQIDHKLSEFKEEITFLEVNTFDIPEVAGEYSIMTVPVVLLFVDGKEYLRQARFVPIQNLYEQTKKIVDGLNKVKLFKR